MSRVIDTKYKKQCIVLHSGILKKEANASFFEIVMFGLFA